MALAHWTAKSAAIIAITLSNTASIESQLIIYPIVCIRTVRGVYDR
jgi:hypothetical protein